MSEDVAIRTDGLTKQFGSKTAVEDLDLSIERGQIYGFLGPNGAGKTTTMRMLATLTRPTSGSAWIMGNSITDREAVRSHLGYLPEEPPVFDELTGREHLAYLARLRNIPTDVADRRIEQWLDRFNLSPDANTRLDEYSTGMRQKVGLIQSLMHDPRVIFLDEPTSGLDPRAARTVLNAIGEMTESGRTVFLSTHILPVVEELADVVGVLNEGRLVAEGPPPELSASLEAGEHATLEEVFLSVTTA